MCLVCWLMFTYILCIAACTDVERCPKPTKSWDLVGFCRSILLITLTEVEVRVCVERVWEEGGKTSFFSRPPV